MIDPQVVCRRKEDGSALLFVPDTGKAFALNQVGVVIWEALSCNCSETEILTRLEREFSPLPETAASDLREFLARLHDVGALI